MPENDNLMVQQNPRPKLQGRTLSNWSFWDRVLLVFILVVTAWLGWKVHLIFALLWLPTLLLLFRSSRGYGRVYQDIQADAAGKWRQSFHKGIWWRADDSEGSRFSRWLRRRHSALPAQFVQISAEIDGKTERFCVLHQTDRPYDQLYITARGGAFAGADVNDRTRLVNEMNSLLDQIIAQSGLKAGISHLRITGPFNQMVLAKNFEAGVSPIIARPELFELDEATTKWVDWARRNAAMIPLELERHHASEVWAAIVITIKRRGSWGNLTSQQISETPIIELGKALIEGLRDNTNLDLHDVHSPSLPESALIARTTWDTVRISDYYRRRENGLIPRTDEEVDAILDTFMAEAEAEAEQESSARKRKKILEEGARKGAQEVDRLLDAWPSECIETDQEQSYLRFDGNYMAFLRITGMPEQFRSDQIAQVHSIIKKTWTRFAFVSESISGEAQSNILLFQASIMENFNRAFYSRRVVNDPRRSNKSRNMLTQLDHMSVNTIAQMANGIITVVERDPARLRREVKSVGAKYGRIGFKTEQVKGSARMIDYYFSGTLAANRV